ncbi:hypothetical protein E2C01_014267 [Portunus trituberculatus]|uniref:Uncharacterized protein n=1 Tax=Portunus trituberculatus TaxID=210409 RepID=A0A5B7DJG2_PORTR|nr:hypothetical protein [Portunus trituberculatus]
MSLLTMEARLLPLAKLRAPRESIDGKDAWAESASERGLVVPVHFKSEEGEANLVVLDFVGVVAADVVVEFHITQLVYIGEMLSHGVTCTCNDATDDTLVCDVLVHPNQFVNIFISDNRLLLLKCPDNL